MGFERKNPECNSVEAREDRDQTPKWIMTGTPKELNHGDEKDKKKNNERRRGKQRGTAERPNVPTGCSHTEPRA